jgi:hypothetical protein
MTQLKLLTLLFHDGLDNGAVQRNVWQCQQHHCHEMFNKISSQEIFLYFAGNFCHLTVYTLKGHIIYLLFKNSKSVLQVKIILCRD